MINCLFPKKFEVAELSDEEVAGADQAHALIIVVRLLNPVATGRTEKTPVIPKTFRWNLMIAEGTPAPEWGQWG